MTTTLSHRSSTGPTRGRAPFRARQAKRQAEAQSQSLTQEILDQGARQATAAAQAKAVTQGHLTEAELQAWSKDLGGRLQIIQQHPEQNLGPIEEQIAASAKEPLRLIAQRAAQAKANATPGQCAQCQRELTVQRLDLYHADENLWAVANDLYGKGTPEARAWVAPLLQQVRDDQTAAVIQTLAELKPALSQARQEKLQTKIEYFGNNADRMKYKEIIQARQAVDEGGATAEQIKLASQPLGSGAIESTCRQYQCRFKRTGQFWTMAGDEALMCLETFWRNGRWQELYPHAQPRAALN